MRLTRGQLNRTLLRRQHLLERVDLDPQVLLTHLVGLPALDTTSPYLSLHARLTAFDPYDVSEALEERTMVRLLAMRGALHLLTTDDALTLRPWTQAALDRSTSTDPRPQFERALVQAPPRGTWQGSGAIEYVPLEDWAGEPMREPDVHEIVRRYLRAFGPATAADVSIWAGVTRLRPVLLAMDDLVRHEREDGTVLFDVVGAPMEDADVPAPARLLGAHDNLWLAHAARDRVTDGGIGLGASRGCTIFVDGWLTGWWRAVDRRVEVTELVRDLTPAEDRELADEVAAVEALLAR